MKVFSKLLFSYFILLSSIHESKAQDDCMDIGINLAFVNFWSKEMPFSDLCIQGSRWYSTNAIDSNGLYLQFTNTESFFEYNNVTGYPLSVPIQVSGLDQPQILRRALILENNGIHPAGIYVLKYEGEGKVELEGADVEYKLSQAQNRKEYIIKPAAKGEIILTIYASNRDNPVKNIQVYLPNTEQNDTKFNPAFIDKIKPFSTIRFLNWTQTNANEIENWGDRILPDYYDQSTIKGIAYEFLIDLCNATNKNMWINIPHAANDDFTKQLSELLSTRLNPELGVFVEYSNEVWNLNHVANKWVDQNTNISIPDLQYKYAYHAGKHFRNFAEYWKRQNLTRVLSGWQAFPNIIRQSTEGMEHFGYNNDYEAISCTGNLFLNEDNYNTIEQLGTSLTTNQVFDMLETNMNDFIQANMKSHQDIAALYTKKLVTYESSPYPLVLYPFMGTPPIYADTVYATYNKKKLYDLYDRWIEILKADGVQTMMAFVLADDNKSHYGAFGHLESVFAEKPYLPAYQVLIDNSCIQAVSKGKVEINNLTVFPQPSSGMFQITVQSKPSHIRVIDLMGKSLPANVTLNDTFIKIDISDQLPGIYFAQIKENNTWKIIKLLLQK